MENNPEYLDFELSDNTIVPNEPVELTIRLCYKKLREDTVYAMEVLDNVKAVPIEGKLLNSRAENAKVLEFTEPEDQTNNVEESDTSYPYCKLLLEFSESGVYELCFRRTDKDFDHIDFDTVAIVYRITVE